MRILIVGGTQFVGRHITEAALAAGHEVTLLHRGQTGAGLFPSATHLLADRNALPEGLLDGEWDATVDVSGYVPRQVHALADALAGRGGRFVYISSVSVYDTPVAPGFGEDAPVQRLTDPAVEEVTGATYGPLKAACERVAVDRFGTSTLIVRPTYVVGPYDHLSRFTFWVERVARGGEILAPGPRDAAIQVIDARDLADWTIRLLDRPAGGVFHAVSPAPPFSFGELLEAMVAEVGPPGTTLTWVEPGFLGERGLDGERLPLWSAFDEEADLNAADPSAAFAAGLAPRPLRQTVRETYEHALRHPLAPPPARLAADEEARILAEWHAR
ncbi:NAD-dependent epimerase/dehydratase family protein [Dactylosporangium aurantiacum]|uniref:NAD-dependent epimerase/dehydratase family protein n=1 Tax=Dactylosporangium aurantiacum TaxID=35754 RepID=A0A9Q9MH44_9ACTN|nr:NAD-dependent epimerase/dehydratase family protein [Dactylosporangium aurantiacum]MDG6109726.1 NAD-dependent epimerase/dehydratase family protein [Dactylosporangium aurantiacum]UWZ56334.1 NAD-dependent epimerase/dehydratase family protein [Dactylosporangium aurantiacum]